jgi:uncharacterized protein YidB (DUF937 family)
LHSSSTNTIFRLGIPYNEHPNYLFLKGNIMGLLDSILGSVLGGGGQGQNSGQAALINAVIQMVANKGAGGAASGLGGLGGLVGALTQGGLGNVASSWVGTGQNLPVSPDQITQALGGGGGGAGNILAQLAQAAGMSHGDAASGLSQILPGLVDKLTPDGQVPQQDTLENMLGSLGIGKQ